MIIQKYCVWTGHCCILTGETRWMMADPPEVTNQNLAQMASSNATLASIRSIMAEHSEQGDPPEMNSLAQLASSTVTIASIRTISSANLTPLPKKKFYYSRDPSVTGTDLLPICRICQLPGDGADTLFSPCRCSGTLGNIHFTCLKVRYLCVH